jgi:hypothetical protein
MRGTKIDSGIQESARVHARLFDHFIALTRAELDGQTPGFVEESLREMLASLKRQRKDYGALGGHAPAAPAAMEDAA